MCSVIGIGQHARPRPCGLRLSALLVFGLLIGLLAMHALSPSGMAMPEKRMSADASQAVVVASPQHGCDADDHGCDGGTHHADATCAAAAVTGTPALPALAPSVVCPASGPEKGPLLVPRSRDGGRAPPSLAELRLLRI